MPRLLKDVLIGLAILAGICMIVFAVLMYMVSEVSNGGCGTHDGPYQALTTTDHIDLAKAIRLPVNGGVLLVDNRDENETPLIALMQGDSILWTRELDGDEGKRQPGGIIYPSTLHDIKVQDASAPYFIECSAEWDGGYEYSRMWIERDGDIEFCISW
jgi:hypothetical protein